jgi:glycosyltransferase involved in cell wall biosynthesis
MSGVKTVRVLYLHPVKYFGGSTKSLTEMVRALPPGSVQATAIVPSGSSADALAAVGMTVVRARGVAQWDNTRFGYYRGWRWFILLRELTYWPATILALRRVVRYGPFDLIHCNEVTALLVGILARRMLRVPLVVHVRSLQRAADGGLIAAHLRRLLRDETSAVVAIDEAVRRTLPVDLPVRVIYNGMSAPAEPAVRDSTGPFCVGAVGVLHRAKGVYELLHAVRLLRDRGVDVRVLVVGENARRVYGARGWLLSKLDLAHDVRGDLERYVQQHSLQRNVEFCGFVSDMAQIYRETDAICFASHLDAPGRPVFEAALFGLPAIVAMRNPTSDVVVPGRTGLCIDEPTPTAIAAAIETLAKDRAGARRMGAEARRRALTRFQSDICAGRMLELYGQITARGDASCTAPQLPNQLPPVP